MSNSFAEKFRPKNPKQLIGESQRKIANALLERAERGEVLQEVLFSGDSGIGKTTIALMYIRAIAGQDYDEMPFNCADKTGVDYIRNQVIGTLPFLPLDYKYRVYFLDEIHKLSEEAQSSLLVAIEPVPPHVLLIACTTHPEKLIPTLRSRFTEYRLNPPTIADFQILASWVCKSQGKNLDPKLRDQVISVANGNVRQFERYLQQALDGSFTGLPDEKLPEIELIKLILSGERNIQKWFNSVDESSDFVRQALGMVGYSIAVIKNSNGTQSRIAKAVIKHFGDSPTRNIDSKYTFYHKLLLTYEEAIGNGS